MSSNAGTAAGSGSDAVVYDVSSKTFAQGVLEASKGHLVVLDCYADWCPPCKKLAPILTKVITETNGKAKMAKLNTDTNPQLAQMLKVQSLPTVFAISNGQIVDKFIGLSPEPVIKSWVDGALKKTTTTTIKQ